jgi:hypothetical protein
LFRDGHGRNPLFSVYILNATPVIGCLDLLKF